MRCDCPGRDVGGGHLARWCLRSRLVLGARPRPGGLVHRTGALARHGLKSAVGHLPVATRGARAYPSRHVGPVECPATEASAGSSAEGDRGRATAPTAPVHPGLGRGHRRRRGLADRCYRRALAYVGANEGAPHPDDRGGLSRGACGSVLSLARWLRSPRLVPAAGAPVPRLWVRHDRLGETVGSSPRQPGRPPAV